jgi:uncharacterized RDD family membrane protein YckC
MAAEQQSAVTVAEGPPPLAVRASFGARLLARILDQILLALVESGIILAATLPSRESIESGSWSPLLVVAYLTAIAVNVVYFIVCWRMYGCTLGYLIFGLRLVNIRGEHPSWGQAVGRYFAQFLSAAVFGMGFFWALGEDRRTWHDILGVPTRSASVDSARGRGVTWGWWTN